MGIDYSSISFIVVRCIFLSFTGNKCHEGTKYSVGKIRVYRTANRRCGISKNNDRGSRERKREMRHWLGNRGGIPMSFDPFPLSKYFCFTKLSLLPDEGRRRRSNNRGGKISIVHDIVNLRGFNIENAIYFTAVTIYQKEQEKFSTEFSQTRLLRDATIWNSGEYFTRPRSSRSRI